MATQLPLGGVGSEQRRIIEALAAGLPYFTGLTDYLDTLATRILR